jgi:hypothetical protein
VVEVCVGQDHVGHVAPAGTDVGESGDQRRLATGGPGVNEQDPRPVRDQEAMDVSGHRIRTEHPGGDLQVEYDRKD